MANRSQISKLPVVTEPMPKVDDLNCLPETIQKVNRKHDTLEILERSIYLYKNRKNNKKPTVFPSLVFSTLGYHWTDKSGGGHGAFMASSTSSGGEPQSR